MRKVLHSKLLLSLMLFTGFICSGQMTFTPGAGLTQAQNFDGLPVSNTNNTISASRIGQNWYKQSNITSSTAPDQALANLIVITGSTVSGISAAVYNCASSANSTDRAVGSVASSSGSPRLGVRLVNNTGKTISSFVISGVTEKYRNGSSSSVTERMVFSYSTTGVSSISGGTTTNWTNVPELDMVEPSNGNTDTSLAVDGNLPANKTAFSGIISGLSIPDGQGIWIRWTDSDATGNDALLALDDVVITAVSGPVVTTLPATNNTAFSFVLNGNTKPDGETVGIHFEYGLSENALQYNVDAVPATASGTGTVTFSSPVVTGLVPGTTYYYRAVITNPSGGVISYGSVVQAVTNAYVQQEPVAYPAGDVASDQFIANWAIAPGADLYLLDVSTSPTFTENNGPAVTTTETFTNAPNLTNSGSYLDRTWTGDNNITWTATKSLTNQTISTNDKAITLGNPNVGSTNANGILESGVITNGISKLSFKIRRYQGGTGTVTGAVTVKILNGLNYSNIAYTTTYNYTTSNQLDVNEFTTGDQPLNIAGDYKIRIENVPANGMYQRPVIDDLSFTSLNSTVPSFVTDYNALPVTGTSHVVTGVLPNTTYYYRLRAKDTTYTPNSVSGNSNTITVKTARLFIWTGTEWQPAGYPDITDDVAIQGNYTVTANNTGNTTPNKLLARSIRVTGGTFTVSALTTVVIDKALTVLSPGAVIIESDGALLQNDATAQNTGNVRVLRDNGSLYRLDYSLWSAPVGGQNLLAFSPLTALNRFYKYDTAQNLYVSNTHDTTFNPETDSFEPGRGYLIRMPNYSAAPGYNQGTAPVTFSGDFTGTLTNGTVAVNLSTQNLGYNAIGNPYASPVDADAFLTQNAEGGSPVLGGTLYFWRKRNAVEGDAYATYTKMGGVAGSGTSGESANGELVTATPTGVILPGQGFIVKALQGGSQNLFANSQRLAAVASNFFRAGNATEKHRMWFTLTSPQGVTYNALVGYMEGATNHVDNAIDGERFNTANDGFYSVLSNTQYAVQGRALPFTVQDEVAMGYRANTAGTYSITLDKVDGLFLQGQPVYLKDRVTGAVHHIKEGAYSFTTEAGTFNDRFVVVYSDAPAMDTKDNTINANSVVVYKQGAGLVVSTGNVVMDSVRVYDIQGRAIYTKSNVNAATLTMDSLDSQQQVLIVQVSTPKGTVSKKVVF